MTVAYPGAPGAFSHEACLRFLPGHEAVSWESFAEVLSAVEAGEVEFGVLPLSNNQAGETGARELIEAAPLRVMAEHGLPVRMHLLGLRGARLEEIGTVVSHPVALRQCARVIGELGASTEEADNTALAAARLNDRSRAVLASEAAARIYGLAILKRDVHDRPDNMTTFAVVAREQG